MSERKVVTQTIEMVLPKNRLIELLAEVHRLMEGELQPFTRSLEYRLVNFGGGDVIHVKLIAETDTSIDGAVDAIAKGEQIIRELAATRN